MPAATFAAVSALEVVLCGKAFITFGGKVVIPFFQGDLSFKSTHITKIQISYLDPMIVLVNKYLLGKGFSGITLWPFVILKTKSLQKDEVFLNHERIHYLQQQEMLVLPFYFLYAAEFLVGWIKYRNFYIAYKNISFEREAYANEKDLSYCKNRSFWNFRDYFSSSVK